MKPELESPSQNHKFLTLVPCEQQPKQDACKEAHYIAGRILQSFDEPATRESLFRQIAWM